MMNGLDINESDFCKMSLKNQNLILFRNIKEIKRQVEGYKLYYKITAIIGSILIGGMILLFKMQLGAQ
jgi:hypothetical protein